MTSHYEKRILRKRGCYFGGRKLPIDNSGNTGRCNGIDNHNVWGLKVAWTKWEPSNIKGRVILVQQRNEGAHEPLVAILEYLVTVAKPCITNDLQFSVRKSQPVINNTRET